MNKIPNSDIIGYEGHVGHEKAIHKSRFTMPKVKLRKTKPNEYEWVEYKTGRYKRMKKGVQDEQSNAGL